MNNNDAGPFFVFMVIGLPIAYGVINRVLAHRERMEMIARGMTPPPDPRMVRRMARHGNVNPGAFNYGVPPPAGPLPPYDPYAYSRFQANKTLRSGIVLSMIGLALLIGLSFIRGHFGPWLLGGLIPMFVGLAQVILAILSGAQFGLPARGDVHRSDNAWDPGVPPQAPFRKPPADMPAGPYGWRPGPTTELERPVPPPDVRS